MKNEREGRIILLFFYKKLLIYAFFIKKPFTYVYNYGIIELGMERVYERRGKYD